MPPLPGAHLDSDDQVHADEGVVEFLLAELYKMWEVVLHILHDTRHSLARREGDRYRLPLHGNQVIGQWYGRIQLNVLLWISRGMGCL